MHSGYKTQFIVLRLQRRDIEHAKYPSGNAEKCLRKRNQTYIRPLFLRYASRLFEAIRERSGQKLSAAKRFYRDYILFIRIPIRANSSINRQTTDVLRFSININRIREKSGAERLKAR